MFWGLFISLSLVNLEPDPQDVAKALQFQYEEKLKSLETENSKLKNENEGLKKKEPTKIHVRKPNSPSAEESARELKVYREALKDVQNENWNEAIVSMETFVRNFPESDLADHALYWIAEIYFQKGENELGMTELERLLQLYPKGTRARRARLRLAELRSNSLPSPRLPKQQTATATEWNFTLEPKKPSGGPHESN